MWLVAGAVGRGVREVSEVEWSWRALAFDGFWVVWIFCVVSCCVVLEGSRYIITIIEDLLRDTRY